MTSSRYHRPLSPRPIALTERDRAILVALDTHRFLTAQHLQALFFAGVSLRRVQARLRQLWENGLVERLFLPRVVGVPERHPLLGAAIYALGRGGAALLPQGGKSISHPRGSTIDCVRGAGNLLHALVVTDLLVALIVACRRPEGPALAGVLRESELWSTYLAARRSGAVRGQAVVSDGAFALDLEGRTFAFHVEVIRADLRGGTRRFVAKLGRYAELVRSGFFRHFYGQALVRAVLIATPTRERAEQLRERAGRALQHGRGLYWFTWFEERSESGVARSRFAPETILTLPWTDLDGQSHCLARPSS